jgi:Na+/H+-translocating membrane pyrophosphatase
MLFYILVFIGGVLTGFIICIFLVLAGCAWANGPPYIDAGRVNMDLESLKERKE